MHMQKCNNSNSNNSRAFALVCVCERREPHALHDLLLLLTRSLSLTHLRTLLNLVQ